MGKHRDYKMCRQISKQIYEVESADASELLYPQELDRVRLDEFEDCGAKSQRQCLEGFRPNYRVWGSVVT